MRKPLPMLFWLVAFIVAGIAYGTDGLLVVGAVLMLIKIGLAARDLATAGPPEEDEPGH